MGLYLLLSPQIMCCKILTRLLTRKTDLATPISSRFRVANHFRIAMPPEATEAGADIDIYVEDPNGDIVAQSTSGGTDELIDITFPMDGNWTVWVHGWLAPGGSSDYNMYTSVLSTTPGGSLSIDSAPASATLGTTETIEVSWTGATAGQWYSVRSHTMAILALWDSLWLTLTTVITIKFVERAVFLQFKETV